jgi:hypothetical protein
MVMNKSEPIHTTETIVILVGAVLGRYPRETLSRWWPTRGSDRYSCFLGIGHGKGSPHPQLLGRDGGSCKEAQMDRGTWGGHLLHWSR